MASKTVVLVHGGFVDGSGWQRVYHILRNDGYDVRVVQNPTLSLEGDVAATKRIIHAQGEPVILVGHSYGGAVITGAGADPNVAALVYIAAFAPDKGESVNTRIADFPPTRPGRQFCRRRTASCSWIGRSFMTRSRVTWTPTRRRSWRTQVPWGVDALGGTISEPAGMQDPRRLAPRYTRGARPRSRRTIPVLRSAVGEPGDA